MSEPPTPAPEGETEVAEAPATEEETESFSSLLSCELIRGKENAAGRLGDRQRQRKRGGETERQIEKRENAAGNDIKYSDISGRVWIRLPTFLGSETRLTYHSSFNSPIFSFKYSLEYMSCFPASLPHLR